MSPFFRAFVSLCPLGGGSALSHTSPRGFAGIAHGFEIVRGAGTRVMGDVARIVLVVVTVAVLIRIPVCQDRSKNRAAVGDELLDRQDGCGARRFSRSQSPQDRIAMFRQEAGVGHVQHTRAVDDHGIEVLPGDFDNLREPRRVEQGRCIGSI